MLSSSRWAGPGPRPIPETGTRADVVSRELDDESIEAGAYHLAEYESREDLRATISRRRDPRIRVGYRSGPVSHPIGTDPSSIEPL